MKKALHILAGFLLIFTSVILQAQPQYYNYNAATNNNAFPFNSLNATGKSTQTLYLPGAFNQPTASPSGNITKIYFQASTTASATYTQLIIKMGLTTDIDLPTSAWYTGTMTTVFDHTSYTLSGTSGQFSAIILDTPFYYDSTKSLVVEISQCGYSGTGINVHYTILSGLKRSAGPLNAMSCPHGWGNQNNYSTHTGIDVNTILGIDPISGNIPNKFSLEQNYPNPFNPVTSIRFSIPKSNFVTLKIYDAIGNVVGEPVNDQVTAGTYEVKFDASQLSSGVYFYTLKAGDFTSTKKMALIK